jgi:glycine reductase
MFGTGAEMCPYACHPVICLDPIPANGIQERDFEAAVKIAGLKTAVFLAASARGVEADTCTRYEIDMLQHAFADGPGLPRIAYYYQLHTPQHDYWAVSDPILYGAPIAHTLPTIIHPNAILDGALVSPSTMRGVDTHTIQNHPLINELYKRHMKELVFAGTVIGVAASDTLQRERTAVITADLMSHVLRADGAILTKVHGGLPDAALKSIAGACEAVGVKTVSCLEVWGSIPGPGIVSGSFPFDGQVNIGQTVERIVLSKPHRILAGNEETSIYNPGLIQKAGDAAIEIERFLMAGAFDLLGGSKVIAVED